MARHTATPGRGTRTAGKASAARRTVAEATGARPDPAATTPAGRGPAFRYFDGDEQAKAFGLFQILGEDGSCHDDDVSGIDQALARRLLHGMLYIRVVDARMMALQRQGRIGFYGEAMGQEAAVVGSAAVLGPEDWIVPALREAGAGLLHGMPLSRYIAQIFGNADDVSKGRQMPCHPCDRDSHYVVMSSCVSTQIPHAVGVAMGMKLSGDRGRLCIGYMGDGGTSEGDFHVALNFAGVTQAPVVLVCQNNQWAISTPGSAQTAAPTIAAKGLGYGLESLRVDGNDVFAVYEAVKYAADKARSGGGPTFLELLTYRVSAHSSSDDPSRYRDESVTEEWKRRRDPLVRLEAFMLQRGWLAGGEVERLSGEIEAEVRAEIARQELVGPPEHRTLFEDVYEQPTWLQREQEQALDAQLEAQLRARTTSQGE